MDFRAKSGIRARQAAVIGVADALVWTWYLQTMFKSRFVETMQDIPFFQIEYNPYSVIPCIAVTCLIVATRWDAAPNRYRAAVAALCSLSTFSLMAIAAIAPLQGSAIELGVSLLFVCSYFASQILRPDAFRRCDNIRTMLLALVISFVSYYVFTLALVVAPYELYSVIVGLAPLAFLAVFAANDASQNDSTPSALPNAAATRQGSEVFGAVDQLKHSFLNLPTLLMVGFGVAGGLLSAAGGCNPAHAVVELFEKPSPAYLAMALSFIALMVVVASRQRYAGAMYFAGIGIVWPIGSLLGTGILSVAPQVPPVVFAVAASLAGIAIVATFIIKQDFLFSEFEGDGQADASGSRENALAMLSGEAGLTPREMDVFRLLAEGRSVPYIQEKLVVSEGTARTHVKHIYAKLNVHGKQELLDLVIKKMDA